MLPTKDRIVLLLSGGIRSSVLLHDAIQRGHDVHPVFFDYGQKAAEAEKKAAEAAILRSACPNPLVVIDISAALATAVEASDHPEYGRLEASPGSAQAGDESIPGLLAIMLLFCGGLARRVGAARILVGSDYSDAGVTRVLWAAQGLFLHSFDLGTVIEAPWWIKGGDERVMIAAPLIRARELGIASSLASAHSCLDAERCEVCLGCRRRKLAFSCVGFADPQAQKAQKSKK